MIAYSSYSQDVIITNQSDTIDCKITRVTNDFIHFSVFDKSGVLLMRSRLPLSEIAHYTQDLTAIPTEPQINEDEKVIFDEFKIPSLRLALNTGFTYQLGGYDGLPRSYADQLQSLWHFGGELNYFLTDNFGIGVKYSYIFTTADQDFEPPISTIFGFSRLRDERVTFNYLAVSLMHRSIFSDDQAVNYFISGGIVRYRTDGLGDGVPFFQEGSTFGVALGISYDFRFIESVGMGAGLEVNIARLSEFDNNGTVVPADFSLSRIDLTLGVRLFR